MNMIKLFFICTFVFHLAACSTPVKEVRDIELSDSSIVGARIAAEKIYERKSQNFPLKVRGSIDAFKAESAISLRYNKGEERSLGDTYILENTQWTGEEGELIGIGERRETEVNHNVDIKRYSLGLTLIPVRNENIEFDFGMGIVAYDFNLKASSLGRVSQVSDKSNSLSIIAGLKYFLAPELAIAFNGTAYRLASKTQRDIDVGLEYQATNWLRLNVSYFTYSGGAKQPEVDARYIRVSDLCLDDPDFTGDFIFGTTCVTPDLADQTEIEFDSFSGIKAGATYTF